MHTEALLRQPEKLGKMLAVAQRVPTSCTPQSAIAPVPILRFTAHVGQLTVGDRCATECVMSEEIEEWRAVNGYEGLYEVSSDGRMRSLTRIIRDNKNRKYVRGGRILKQLNNTNGYPIVCLHGRGKPITKTVHRIAAKAFLPVIEGKNQVNHKNGVKHDNRIENFEWVTHAENIQHAHTTGLAHPSKGSRNGRAKLCEADIPVIRACKESQRKIAKRFGVSRITIQQIKSGKLWRHALTTTNPADSHRSNGGGQ